jgi:hypothetical protein
MESEVMKDESHIAQVVERWKDWDEVFSKREGFQEVVYLQKIVVPTRDTRKDEYTRPIFQWKRK